MHKKTAMLYDIMMESEKILHKNSMAKVIFAPYFRGFVGNSFFAKMSSTFYV